VARFYGSRCTCMKEKKGKASCILSKTVWAAADPVDIVVNPSAGCHHFPTGPQLPSQLQSITGLGQCQTTYCTIWFSLSSDTHKHDAKTNSFKGFYLLWFSYFLTVFKNECACVWFVFCSINEYVYSPRR